MTCTTHFTDANSCGYLMSQREFGQAVEGCLNDALYADVAEVFGAYGWRLSQTGGAIEVEVAGRRMGLDDAYALFTEDHVMHERVYQRCMTIWR